MCNKKRIGIDLGTTYSSVASIKGTYAQPLANSEGDFLTPSAVFFKGDGGVIVGKDALDLGAYEPEQLVTNAKRLMGTVRPCIEVGGVWYSPVDISAMILRQLIQDATAKIGPFEEATVTVPAHFNAIQRQQTVDAGLQAGLKRVEIVSEPVAAALSHVLATSAIVDAKSRRKGQEENILVFDLGGGTFDLSIVRFNLDRLRVRAATGDLELGGIDWDQVLVDEFNRVFKVIYGDDLTLPEHERSLRRLALEVVRAKEELSLQNVIEVEVQARISDREVDFQITQEDFEKLAGGLVQRTRDLTEDILKMANLGWEQIDMLMPTGGATRMPMIKRVIREFLAKGPRLVEVSADLAVCKGAALFAAITDQVGNASVDGEPVSEVLQNYQTTNVSSHGVGIIVRNGNGYGVHQLIPENTRLPALETLSLATVRDNQRRASIRIIEGAMDRNGSDGVICKCTIDNLPEGIPRGSLIDVDVSLGADGLLEVIAKHRESGRHATVSLIR